MPQNNRERITDLQQAIKDCDGKLESLKQKIQGYESELGTIQNNHSEKVQALNDEMQKLSENAATLLEEIENYSNASKSQIKALLQSSEQSKTTFEEQNKNIEEIRKKIDSLEEEIVNQLGRAASGVLAQAFDERQGKLESELKKWENYLFWSTLFLFGVGVFFFLYSFYVDINYQYWLKISVLFPIIYTVWFSGRQYEKERKIVEQYAFKSAKAKSLSAFSKLVEDAGDNESGPNRKETKERTQQFIIESMKEIYKAPNLELKDVNIDMIKKMLDSDKK